ncbi:uncharacterized protein LOC34618544 [Cyclospora cayetanensis]|uniref:Uncharacterized protein LOC34618544 n=1 Tax=Cyclospora cayetanensis TaxID=88456 RepID=A0A6P6S2Q6_9EIME|nr:uncharacterized protein LOC34618544 [Cyclospora cayetanensis]
MLGVLSPFASLTALCLWLVELFDATLAEPQAAAAELVSLAGAPPAFLVLDHFNWFPVWNESPTCGAPSVRSTGSRYGGSAALHGSVFLGGGGAPWHGLDVWGLCLPVGSSQSTWRLSENRGPLGSFGARGALQLGIYCRIIVDVPLLTLAMHLSRWLYLLGESFGAPLNVEDGFTPEGGTSPETASSLSRLAAAAASSEVSSPPSSAPARDGRLAESYQTCRGPLGGTKGMHVAAWLRLAAGIGPKLLRLLQRCLLYSPMAFFFSSTRRLYFSVMTYMLTRWMYTDRLDALLGAPSSAVMGPLSKGPPEGQALLMCLAILCAAGLVASISVLSLLKAADLLPSRLLHYTRVLSCTHLLLQEDVKKKSSSRSSAPVEGSRSQGDPIEVSHDDFQPGDATPSSAHSKEQEVSP